MSELIQRTDNRATIRWKLLAGASAIALAGYISSAGIARADDDTARPLIWLEADTQFALQSVNREAYYPPFVYNSPFTSAFDTESKKIPSDWDEGAKISFQPSGSDWLMSLGIRYGKSHRHGTAYQQTTHTWYYYYNVQGYQDSQSSSSEKHLILDFQAGKDFGLGMFGHGTEAVVSIGVRYAQFDSRSHMNVQSVTPQVPVSYYIFHASLDARRTFRGIGPSLSWDASTNLAGDRTNGSLTFDWGVNGALLFGRQRVNGHHEKTALYQEGLALAYYPRTIAYQTAVPLSRSKNVTVPDLGAYAALSLQYTNAKVTFGYRYDAFFGAIDGGIDTVKKENRIFNGPYASISVGIGD